MKWMELVYSPTCIKLEGVTYKLTERQQSNVPMSDPLNHVQYLSERA